MVGSLESNYVAQLGGLRFHMYSDLQSSSELA